MQTVTTIGLDIAKSVFQIHGIDAAGNVIVRPCRMDDRLKNRNRDVAAGRAASQRAALAVGV